MTNKGKIKLEDLIKVDETCYEIPQSYQAEMRVPARLFADELTIHDILLDRSLWQLTNVATLPGIINAAYAMPDIHEGYGFPIGGVAAFDITQDGVISPGGIGYDINCGVRLLAADVTADEIRRRLPDLATALFHAVPSGVGKGSGFELKESELDAILRQGAEYMFQAGYGNQTDLDLCEENGKMVGADAALISKTAKSRGANQLGTLGSGNHFLEIQKVAEIFDQKAAEILGLQIGQVTIMIHCGSRGLGHQVCTDSLRSLMPHVKKWGFNLPDRELICAPFTSPEGQNYFSAMQAAANFAWANRHMIGHWTRKAWQKILGREHDLRLVYDISHNMGKKETHLINGKSRELIVHRKGATRAFGPGSPYIPDAYRTIGQPVLIPGTMGTASYVMIGTSLQQQVAFGSSCHGAGRRMSRMQAKKEIRGNQLRGQLEAQGILVRCDSNQGLAEEGPKAYKDIEAVIHIVERAQLAKRVARVVPIAVIKGG